MTNFARNIRITCFSSRRSRYEWTVEVDFMERACWISRTVGGYPSLRMVSAIKSYIFCSFGVRSAIEAPSFQFVVWNLNAFDKGYRKMLKNVKKPTLQAYYNTHYFKKQTIVRCFRLNFVNILWISMCDFLDCLTLFAPDM